MSDISTILDKKVFQAGMGVGVSGYELANKTSGYKSRHGYAQMGIVSATAADTLLVRGLQNGDFTGDIREALMHFPNQEIARNIEQKFFVEGGIGPQNNFRLNPFPTFEKISPNEFAIQNKDLEDTLVAGAFVEVYLAKRGHINPIGANYLHKIGWALPATLYGAMLAGVDVALVGAGFARDIPELITSFTKSEIGKMVIPVSGKDYRIAFDPKRYLSETLNRPIFLAIVSNHLGVKALSNADGHYLENARRAGGHNPNARNKVLTELGEPSYGADDEIDFKLLRSQLQKNYNKTGKMQPFWLGGNYAARLNEALELGAQGVAVGTPFAFCKESRITSKIKHQALTEIINGIKVFTNPRASPSGFPFKELPLPGTIGHPDTYAERKRLCNLGYLIELFENANNEIDTRCSAEPVPSYLNKGGNLSDTIGRKCLCNGLCATIGLGMKEEKPLITTGEDFTVMKEIVAKYGMTYTAENVIDYIFDK